MGQTVNLLVLPSVVRIRLSPPSLNLCAGIAQLARALAFQAKGRGFESRFPLQNIWICPYSSGVERILGKDEVIGSNPIKGSIIFAN